MALRYSSKCLEKNLQVISQSSNDGMQKRRNLWESLKVVVFLSRGAPRYIPNHRVKLLWDPPCIGEKSLEFLLPHLSDSLSISIESMYVIFTYIYRDKSTTFR